ncbi:MAG: peptidylprolyl isomerase [Pseudomonadota bacterium]
MTFMFKPQTAFKLSLGSMLRGSAAISLATGLALSAPAAFAQDADPGEVLARVGDAEITRADVEIDLKELGAQFQRVPENQRIGAVVNTLIDFEVMSQKAEADGLGSDPEFEALMRLNRKRALHDTYFRKTEVEQLDEAAVQAAYEQQTAPLRDQVEVRARHILLETEEAAREVIAELDGGGDFETLAKEKSTGPSGPAGGDLGFFGKGRMVPAFEEAAFALEAGTYTTDPVQTQFGFHVIKVEENRPVPVPPLAQVEAQIRQQLLQQRYVEAVRELREATEIEIVAGQPGADGEGTQAQ